MDAVLSQTERAADGNLARLIQDIPGGVNAIVLFSIQSHLIPARLQLQPNPDEKTVNICLHDMVVL